MSKYTRELFGYFSGLIFVAVIIFINWYLPIYLWLDDTALYRFIWLGIFFILIDFLFELITRIMKAISMMAENIGFSKDIRKLSDGFHLASKVSLPNNSKADYVAVGSSGVWLVNVKDGEGAISFNGEDLVQKGQVLKGLLTKSLERSYALADLLKKKLNHNFIVTPVIAFSSPKANLNSLPEVLRGVHISSRKNINSLIENTDVQLIDKNTAEEIYKVLRK